ncbi:hypothetical protein ECHHL_0767 [Ehrlichia chaffeensis str. Heartland]|uniref:Uncharacterized protein n=1 Tax=Ehrlichia chaffeensis (strain ATCC CRL-10679 / Arkansas) TaxID=205920 RepID=Q2GFX1_EHRCR|nr:hypothetical protein ECH_0867 [Ehrlichia chaffeensis str. Arkansas]AHX03912.1 hypothetical protein ECHHL_0767 [Ehrlichia chaffeensis str. Heartland]AHX05359.1 hypothetical protein ECHJAX_0282 [Ehrlichia chaffeensis str. Jax]AHX06346.1 hypothetical protein ECHLIB_0278 [Ehrlichia chaffeensis str. Liberty]AHX07744.1 hypothetical protein ECHOSC_0778 [Ehrlichia chaffeensis str. Osceola]AHX09057.1 hypothetical protein ECHWAK_0279 [Ehrlichia chaffeensis str. Wakulla]AHX10395.1 hypothetical protei
MYTLITDVLTVTALFISWLLYVIKMSVCYDVNIFVVCVYSLHFY